MSEDSIQVQFDRFNDHAEEFLRAERRWGERHALELLCVAQGVPASLSDVLARVQLEERMRQQEIYEVLLVMKDHLAAVEDRLKELGADHARLQCPKQFTRTCGMAWNPGDYLTNAIEHKCPNCGAHLPDY